MLRKAIADIQAKYARKDIPEMRSGDTVRVHTKIKEGDKERVQIFEGTVNSYRKGSPGSSMFTVRKVSYGVGVERMFPVHSPRIDKIEVMGHGEGRRSRLYYLRALQGKAARLHQEEGAGEGGLLEHPHYTRPPEFRGARVPEVLLSGDHRRIERWRRRESLRATRERRPDLWERFRPSADDLRLIDAGDDEL